MALDFVGVGRRGFQTVGQPTFGIDADMGLHTDIPLIAFGGLVYLGVTLSTLVFGGARGHR